MKRFKIFALIILLIIIGYLPVSAKENKLCTRTKEELHVKDKYVLDGNYEAILNTPCVDSSEKVYDFADLLSDSEEELLFNEITNYINKTNYDLVVVTTNENNKVDAMNYADDFFLYNEFGFGDTLDGTVLLIDMKTREVRVENHGYASKMYDDYRVERIIDSGYDDIKDQKYYNSFKNMIWTLNNYFNSSFPDSNSNLYFDSNGEPYYKDSEGNIYYKDINGKIYFKDSEGNIYYPKPHVPVFLIIIVSSVISLIVSISLYFKSKLKIKVLSTISYLKDKNITVRQDKFINSVVTHTRIDNDSSSGSHHSSGGGSSFHTSSGGSSFSGGGRHF